MKLLHKWFSLRYRLRSRRWRVRAITAEKELALTRLQLAAETWRNRAREDTFASAAILGSRNMWGLAPRNGPALIEQTKAQVPAVDPYNLSGADQMEFETFWKPDAEAMGIPLNQAKQRFINEVVLPRRMPLQDDPFNGAN